MVSFSLHSRGSMLALTGWVLCLSLGTHDLHLSLSVFVVLLANGLFVPVDDVTMNENWT